MTEKFKEIVALTLYHNVKCRLDIGINRTYYLIKYDGDSIVWEIDDRPDKNDVYLYDAWDNKWSFDKADEYYFQALCAEQSYEIP